MRYNHQVLRRSLYLAPLFLQAPLRAGQAAVRPIRVGVIGAGHAHGAAKVQLLAKDPRFDLVGLAAESDEVAARHPNVRKLTREQILADASITLCFIEGDIPQHGPDAMAALEAGKHVHVEKPPALTVRELQAMHALAKRKGLLLQQGYMWRFHPAMNRILQSAREGQLGEIYLIRGMINTTLGPTERKAVARYAGGQMFELGCHLIDPIVRLMGRPKKVTAVLREESGDGLRDNTMATLEFEKAMAIVSSATLMRNATNYRGLEVFGSKGNAILRPIEGRSAQLVLETGSKVESIPYPAYQRYVGEMEELASCIAAGRPLSVSAEEDLAVQETLLRASGMYNEGRG